MYRGSEWHIWDLHVHTPESIVQRYSCSQGEDVWEKYSMYLNDEVLEDIEIVLSPEADEGHRLIVEALCKQYLKNPHPNIQQSTLGNRVRFK